MTQTEKHIWLIETIRRAGRISLEELSQKWRDNEELSRGKDLQRCTFNRWRIQIAMQYGVDIECEKFGSYLYYIANPEELEESELKKWMLDSVSVSNIIAGNKGLSNRIVVDEIPSGRDFLAPILAAMKENQVLSMTYQAFGKMPIPSTLSLTALNCTRTDGTCSAKEVMADFGFMVSTGLRRLNQLAENSRCLAISMPRIISLCILA